MEEDFEPIQPIEEDAVDEVPIEDSISEQPLEEEKEVITDTEIVTYVPQVHQSQNSFEKAMESVKTNILNDATQDEEFVSVVKENIKGATLEHTEVEKAKASLKKQAVQYQSEELANKQARNVYEANEDKWSNKQNCREYHFNGVKPIMHFVGIEEPLNLILLYVITILLLPLFLISKVVKATFGNIADWCLDPYRTKGGRIALFGLYALVIVGIIGIIVLEMLIDGGIISKIVI